MVVTWCKEAAAEYCEAMKCALARSLRARVILGCEAPRVPSVIENAWASLMAAEDKMDEAETAILRVSNRHC